MNSRGYSLLEAIFILAAAATVFGAAIPLAFGSIDRTNAAGAASYLAGRLSTARLEAVRRSASVAIRFAARGDSYAMQTFVDGNANGVLARDIADGIDTPVSAEEQLSEQFSTIRFGILPGVGPVDPRQPFNAADPIQIGTSSLMSFSPAGSSTSGTLFIRGAHGSQYAVRVLGATGRTRVLRFNFGDGTWQSR